MSRVRINVTKFPEHAQLSADLGRAFVGISLNNRTMESSVFIEAIFNWSWENVGEFDFLIGDYLNRYNYRAFDGDSEMTAVEKAKQAGNDARKRLVSLISRHDLEGRLTAISAAELCERSCFADRLAHFRQCYSDSFEFTKIVDDGVDAFLSRRHPLFLTDAKIRRYCVQYQLEELAMFEQLASEGFGVFIYPGAQLPIMKSLVAGDIGGISTGIRMLTLVELRIFEDIDL
jgi:tRNA-dependent cyclodipeptide synthase